MQWWISVPIAIVLGLVIWKVGIGVLRGLTTMPPARDDAGPEDVEELDVYLVCAECGTEFQVTRVGQLQIPRHCGEPMQVVRRPRDAPADP